MHVRVDEGRHDPLARGVDDLGAFGLGRITRVKHVTGVGDWNRRYLVAKQDWGHQIDSGDLESES